MKLLFTPSPAGRSFDVIERIGVGLAMKNLSAGRYKITVTPEALKKCLSAFRWFNGAEVGAEKVHTSCRWQFSQKHADPRRIADRRLAVCVRHRDATPRQCIDMRRLYLRVPTVAPQPIIQIVDRDEQHVRFLFRSRETTADDQDKQDGKQGSHSALLYEEQTGRGKC